MFAELLFSAIAIVTPQDGATVPLLTRFQRGYLSFPRVKRFDRFDDADFRRKLAKVGDRPQEVELAWTGDPASEYTVSFDGNEFVVSNTCSVRLTNLVPGSEYRWGVSVSRGTNGVESVSASFKTEANPPRLIYVEGMHNFRDMGGWSTKSGRKVRMNMMFRSAGLRGSARRTGETLSDVRYTPGAQRVTAFGLATLEKDLGIRTDFELRPPREAMCLKSSLIPGARWVNIPFFSYESAGDDVKGRYQFARIFRELLDPANYPVLFHCSGGHDCTGTVAFMLNGLLGVSEDDLCRDWEVSAFVFSDLSLNTDCIARLCGCFRSHPGSDLNERIENYVMSCGISRKEIAQFRDIMLEGGAE